MNPDLRPSPGGDHERPPQRGAETGLGWANLLVIGACLGVILLAGVPLSKRFVALLERGAGPSFGGDEYTYFFDDHELERRLYSALYFPAHHGEDLEAEVLELRIVGLGPDVVPVILGVLCGDLQLLPGHPPQGLELQPLEEERFLPNRDVLLVAALWRFEPRHIYDPLARWMSDDPSLGQRLIATRVLAKLEDQRSPELLLRILASTEPSELARPHVRAHFETAIAGVLERYPEGIEQIRRTSDSIDPAALDLVVHGMPFGDSGAGLDLILELLEQEPDLGPAVLSRISSLAESTQGAVLDDALWKLEWLVDHADWEIRRGAAIALGKLQDPNSCPQLIRMLEDSERRVGKAALWALRGMSSRNFAADPDLWQGWYEGELSWFEGPCVALEIDLASEDPAAVVRAVGLLCHRPLFRNHMAESLAPVLWNEDPALVQVVCAALEQLGSQRALPHLVKRLADVEDEATPAIRNSLQGLTGLELPAEQEAWSAALGL